MITFCSLALLSAALIGLYRWLAVRYRWLDTPNQRSSHAAITPRGAGVVFALLIVAAAAILLHAQRLFFLPFLAGLAVALTGWWDDLRGAPARTRFLLYVASAAAATTSLFAIVLHNNIAIPATFLPAEIVTPSLPIVHSYSPAVTCGIIAIGGLAATLGLLWLINLYNFMDGINGIAALEALFVLFAINFFALDTPYARTFTAFHYDSGAAIAGFLLWNCPSGKVFMGDAGSAFLGFLLGLLMLWSVLLGGPSLAIWLILLGIFIVDTGYTLLLRIATGQRWHTAHRLHAYQRLTDRLAGSHLRTVSVLMAVNLGWLLPMAWLVHSQRIGAWGGLGLSYVPLIAACCWLKAGISTRAQV